MPFLVGHATHPDWRGALALAGAQVDAQRAAHDSSDAGPLTLGLCYFSDHYADEAEALHAALRERWPRVAWAGAVGVGVAAGGVEYFDEPALVLMLAALPPGRFEVFSGAHRPQRVRLHTALVHADPATPDLAELIAELADRTESGYLFGGLASSRRGAWHLAEGAWLGGLSGVAFSDEVSLISRVTQGCQPIGPTREVTACERNLVLELDGRPALQALLADLGITELTAADGSLVAPREALLRLRSTLAGLTAETGTAIARGGQFGTDTLVRHLIGLDPGREAVAVAEMLRPGMRLAFCQRDVAAARRDLVRICSEIRDEVATLAEAAPATGSGPGVQTGAHVEGAIYVSCSGRGGPHFGGPSAELKIVQHALGDVPLVGFFAAGEIARHHLYGYTGVLTVFVADAAAN